MILFIYIYLLILICYYLLVGYFGPLCEKCQFCNNHGECDGSGTFGGSGKCKCTIFYSGNNCTIPLHILSICAIIFLFILFLIYSYARKMYFKKRQKLQEELTKEIFTIDYNSGNNNNNNNSYDKKNNDENVNNNSSLLQTNLLDDIIDSTQSDQWIIPPETLEIGNLIAIGSTARVYSGKYMSNVNVAIKELYLTSSNRNNIIDDIRSEVTILSRVNHPNIIRFYGVCRYYNSLYFVTEECRCSLSDFLYNSNEKYNSNLYNKFVIQIVTVYIYIYLYIIGMFIFTFYEDHSQRFKTRKYPS